MSSCACVYVCLCDSIYVGVDCASQLTNETTQVVTGKDHGRREPEVEYLLRAEVSAQAERASQNVSTLGCAVTCARVSWLLALYT